MVSETERSTYKQRRWHAWAGSEQDLRRLSIAVDEETASLLKIVLDEVGREEQPEPKLIENSLNDTIPAGTSSLEELISERLRKSHRDRRSDISSDISASMTIIDGDEMTKGPITEVAPEIDKRTVVGIIIGFSASSSSRSDLEVILRRYSYRSRTESFPTGIELKVSSSRRGWANQAFAHLSTEIEKGVPRWAWMRSDVGRVRVLVLSALTIALSVGLGLVPHLEARDRILAIILIIISGLGASILAAVSKPNWYDWFFPGFEITSEGAPSSGSRRLGYLGTLILSLIIGIVATFFA